MARLASPNIIKQPLKVIEIPLNKFSEEVVPHHQKTYEQYKIAIHKLISANNAEQLKKELKYIKRAVKQLRDLMYELETLRTQVEDEDLDKFDSKTVVLRKLIIHLIQGYTELEKTAETVINRLLEFNIKQQHEKENCDPFDGVSQIQMQENLEELKLTNQQETLSKVEKIDKDVQDLHEMYKGLNEMVDVQGENVDYIEKTIDSAQQNVENGARELIKAHKLKAVAYPVTGAFLGGMIGGPIGLVAGLKVGGVAAIGCAIAGYTGGKWFNKANSPENIETEAQGCKIEQAVNDRLQKKDM